MFEQRLGQRGYRRVSSVATACLTLASCPDCSHAIPDMSSSSPVRYLPYPFLDPSPYATTQEGRGSKLTVEDCGAIHNEVRTEGSTFCYISGVWTDTVLGLRGGSRAELEDEYCRKSSLSSVQTGPSEVFEARELQSVEHKPMARGIDSSVSMQAGRVCSSGDGKAYAGAARTERMMDSGGDLVARGPRAGLSSDKDVDVVYGGNEGSDMTGAQVTAPSKSWSGSTVVPRYATESLGSEIDGSPPSDASSGNRQTAREAQAPRPAEGKYAGKLSTLGGTADLDGNNVRRRSIHRTRSRGLPRAGAPRPPRGEVSVWRPWVKAATYPQRPVEEQSGERRTGTEWVLEETPSMAPTKASGVSYPDRTVAPGSRTGSMPGGGDAGAGAGPGPEPEAVGATKLLRWRPKHLTVKAVFFLFYCSLGAVMPYLPVYYHSLDLGDRRIGHLGAITPAISFFCTPLWGALTDKTGCLRQILVITFLFSAIFRVGLVARTSYLWIVSLVSLTAIMNAPVRPLLDSGALQSLEDKSEYGKQRLWGQWGFGIGSFVTGKLLPRFSFRAAFYMHALCSVPTLLILLRFNPKKETKSKEPPKFRELFRLVTNDLDVMAFFGMMFAIGLSSGVIENFAYKRLRELGGQGSCLGVSRLVSSLAGIPMFYYSGAITRRLSILSVLSMAMFTYILRFVIYATISNPWHGMPAEALRGMTFAGFWAASTCHVGVIAPPGLSTTMLGLMNATYGGIGQSLGALIGGSLSSKFGTAKAFLVYAGVDGLILVAYFMFKGFCAKLKARNGEGTSSNSASTSPSMEKVNPPPPQPPSSPLQTPPLTPVTKVQAPYTASSQ